MRCAFSGVVVSGFSVMQSQPASSARTMYSSWKPSGQVTMTQSGFSSFSILSKSAARYFLRLARQIGRHELRRRVEPPRVRVADADELVAAAKVLVMAVRYMREREPTPTFTNLRRLPAAYVLAAKPTAATPAVFNRARRSIVDSLIYMSPTLVVTYDPPRRYLKFDQWRSSARTPKIKFSAHTSPPCTFVALLLCLLSTCGRAASSRRAAAPHRSARAGHAPQPDDHAPSTSPRPSWSATATSRFTADITGLQTFQEQYSPLVPLMTQAQWAWHSFPNPKGFTLAQAQVPVEGSRQAAVVSVACATGSRRRRPTIQWLRENPHRFSLGRLGLYLVTRGRQDCRRSPICRRPSRRWTCGPAGSRAASCSTARRSRSRPPCIPSATSSSCDCARRCCPTAGSACDLKFPGVSREAQSRSGGLDASRVAFDARSRARARDGLTLARQLDDTRYSVQRRRGSRARPSRRRPARLPSSPRPERRQITLLVEFAASDAPRRRCPLPRPRAPRWPTAGRVTGRMAASSISPAARDPRANELERRVVMSQYLTAVNSAGDVPPQEEGLFSNSWNGKFHLEMHVWHAAHFAVWGRPELLERSMPWYFAQLAEAKARAQVRTACAAPGGRR